MINNLFLRNKKKEKNKILVVCRQQPLQPFAPIIVEGVHC